MGPLRLALLGGFQATIGSGPSLNVPTRKAQALLAYLSMQPGQASTREKLAGLLWGDLDSERARNNLRQTLFALRRSLSSAAPSYLFSDGEIVRLASTEVDVIAFEKCTSEGTPDALEKAATLCRGDLLDGFAISEVAFEEWLANERERLRAIAIQALTKLLTLQVKAGASSKAMQTALQLLARDPFQEIVHRTLMGLYAGQGRRAAALKQYQSCVDLLRRELGVEPEPETRSLYQAILQSRNVQRAGATATEPPTTPLPFLEEHSRASEGAPQYKIVGRDRELQRLRDALHEAWRSHGTTVALVGEAGIGKTRIVQDIVREATGRGGRVLVGRCYESEQILPFGPWVDAVRRGGIFNDGEVVGLDRTWRTELARLFPEAAVTGPEHPNEPADYLRLFEAMARLLDSLALQHPLLLVFEDMHWADEMSLRLLSFIGRRVLHWRSLIVLTARSEELADVPAFRQAMQELRGEHGVTELNLSRLSRNDTQALVRGMKHTDAKGTSLAHEDQVWRASEGNPFMAVESCRALQSGATTPTDHIPLPERIRHLLTDRLDRLGGTSRSLVAVAAIIGRDFDFGMLQCATNLDETEAASAVEELVRRGVLRAAGERFQFVHDWMREVADAQVRSPTRAILHRKVGAALEDLHADELEPHYAALGLHYEQGEAWRKAAVYLRRSGHQAATRTAHRDAVNFFERALSALARLPKSKETAELAIDIRFDLRNSRAPRGELMMSSLQEAQAMAEGLSDKHRLARTLGYMTEQMFMVGDYREAISTGERALALAKECGDLAIKVTTNRQVARTYYALGDYQQATRRLQRLLKSLTGDLLHERFDSPPIASVSARMYLAWCHGDLGRFADALATAEEALAIAEAADHPLSIVNACLGLGLVHLERGDVATAILTLERNLLIIHEWDLATFFPIGASAMGTALVMANRAAEAILLLERAVSAADSRGRIEGQSIRIGALANCYAHVGRGAEAIQLGLRALALARKHHERGREARVLRLLGELHMREQGQRRGEGETYYRQGLALAEELGMQPLTAHCHFGLANLLELLRRSGDAQIHRSVATQLYRDMDMPCWLKRIEMPRSNSRV